MCTLPIRIKLFQVEWLTLKLNWTVYCTCGNCIFSSVDRLLNDSLSSYFEMHFEE